MLIKEFRTQNIPVPAGILFLIIFRLVMPVDIAQPVADVVHPQRGARGTLGQYHYQTAEGCPADDVTGQNRAQHLQRFDMFASSPTGIRVFPARKKKNEN